MTEERCKHDMIPMGCAQCRPAPDGLPAYVITTAGGSVFHRTAKCRALIEGQIQAQAQGLNIHAPKRRAVREVLGEGRAPCIVCLGKGSRPEPVPVPEPQPPEPPKRPIYADGRRRCSRCFEAFRPSDNVFIDHTTLGEKLYVHYGCRRA